MCFHEAGSDTACHDTEQWPANRPRHISASGLVLCCLGCSTRGEATSPSFPRRRRSSRWPRLTRGGALDSRRRGNDDPGGFRDSEVPNERSTQKYDHHHVSELSVSRWVFLARLFTISARVAVKKHVLSVVSLTGVSHGDSRFDAVGRLLAVVRLASCRTSKRVAYLHRRPE